MLLLSDAFFSRGFPFVCHHGQIVAMHLDAFIMSHAVFLGKRGDVHDLLQFSKTGLRALEGIRCRVAMHD